MELINLYFRIGQYISENGEYGTKLVKSLSTALKLEFPNTTGYSERNLEKLPWTHNCILIDKVKDYDIRKQSNHCCKLFDNGSHKCELYVTE